MKNLIDINYSETNEFSNLNEKDRTLIQEVLDHGYFCNKTVEKFHGRNDLVDKVFLYA